MIKRFDKIEGRYIEKIYGQDRFGYSQSDNEDLYDLIVWAEQGGYRGSELLFYDFHTGNVYKPFDKKRNTVYGAPVYVEKFLYFLQGDYDSKKVTLYRYMPEKILEKVVQLNMEDVNLYNLIIIGNPLYIISQEAEDGFRCYYPDKISFPLKEQQSVILIEDGKVYIEEWVEEGWDVAAGRATDQYKYYNRIIIKDFAGNTISEELGCLNQSADGDWWIS
ncbi:hypothetical protein BN3660_01435 [Eubacteriaceae bacterium CHKCI004]|nr:hypothetical protein BN3660_01435 [Eubacteriaceae bacterium CHKCI004]